MVGNKDKHENIFPSLLPYSRAQLHSFIFYSISCLPQSEQHKGMGNRRLVSVHNTSSLPLLPLHTFPLFQQQAFMVNLLHHGLSKDQRSFRKYPPALARDPPQAATWICALTRSSPQAVPAPLSSPPRPTEEYLPRYSEALLSPSSPPLPLVLTRLFLILYFFFFLLCPCRTSALYVITEVPPSWLMGSAVSHKGSIVKPHGSTCGLLEPDPEPHPQNSPLQSLNSTFPPTPNTHH